MAAVAGICTVAFGLSAPAAFASPDHGVTAVTHTHHHADTTTTAGSCTTPSRGGPVWAYDNLSFRFRVTPLGTDAYTVTVTASGSFDAFAHRLTPTTCGVQHGSVHGYVNYIVQSTAQPDRADLPPQEPGTTSQVTMLEQLFQTAPSFAITGSSGYSYRYTLTGKRCTTSTTGFSCS